MGKVILSVFVGLIFGFHLAFLFLVGWIVWDYVLGVNETEEDNKKDKTILTEHEIPIPLTPSTLEGQSLLNKIITSTLEKEKQNLLFNEVEVQSIVDKMLNLPATETAAILGILSSSNLYRDHKVCRQLMIDIGENHKLYTYILSVVSSKMAQSEEDKKEQV